MDFPRKFCAKNLGFWCKIGIQSGMQKFCTFVKSDKTILQKSRFDQDRSGVFRQKSTKSIFGENVKIGQKEGVFL